MRILFSPCSYRYDNATYGSEAYLAFSLVDRIASKNTDSVVLTGFNNVTESRPYIIKDLQPKRRGRDLSLSNALRFNLQYFFATVKELKATEFDVIHHVLPFTIDSTFNLAAILGFIKNKPFIIAPIQSPLQLPKNLMNDFNSSNLDDVRKRSKRFDPSYLLVTLLHPLLSYLSKKTLVRADRVVAITNQTKILLTDRGISEDKIVVIPLGIEADKLPFKAFEEKKTETLEIITVAFLQKRKGTDLVVKAFAEVIKKHPRARLRIVGDGPQLKALENLVRELDLRQSVIFEGLILYKDLPTYYQNAHLLVSMSHAESWGQVFLDAMASGLPVISAKSVGPESIIKNGEFGYLVEQEDYVSLAEKITYLFDHPQTMAEFGKNARKEVETKYDWDKIVVPCFLKLYEEVS